jgi:4'-phosphopantetheinyl transferase
MAGSGSIAAIEAGVQLEPSFELDAQEVCVWRAFLDVSVDQVDAFEQILGPEELAEADRLISPRNRVRFVASRGVRRALLGRYLGCEPEALSFSRGRHGKPALADAGEDLSLHFNVSHSAGLALYALTRSREVGVDIERLRPELADERLVDRFFAAPEVAELRALPAQLWSQGFFACWTRKEAYLKASGWGLTFPLSEFAVTASPLADAALVAHRDGDEEAARWVLRSFWPAPGFVATVAVEGGTFRLRQFDWPRTWTR